MSWSTHKKTRVGRLREVTDSPVLDFISHIFSIGTLVGLTDVVKGVLLKYHGNTFLIYFIFFIFWHWRFNIRGHMTSLLKMARCNWTKETEYFLQIINEETASLGRKQTNKQTIANISCKMSCKIFRGFKIWIANYTVIDFNPLIGNTCKTHRNLKILL